MKELFINELRRFRNTTLIAAAVHLVLLLLVTQLYNVLQLPIEMYMVMLAFYMLAGAGLGLYQFGSYRQPSRWIWLMHRPVPQVRIFAALAAAVGVMIACSIGLPALLLIAANDIFSARVVDMRHYLLVPHIMLFVAMAWMCGAYIMLSRSKTAFVLVIVPLWMLLHGGAGHVMLLPALLCLALLAYVVFTAVKPNRVAPPATIGSLLTVSLPLHLGFYFAMIWMGSLGFQYGQMLFGVHPLNMDIDPPGGFVEATRIESRKLILLGLASSRDPRAEHWRRQVALSQDSSNSPFDLRYPVRHALANIQDNSFVADGIRWSFSHDSMRYEGLALRNGKPVPSFGPAFATPPIKVTINDNFSYLLQPHALYGMQTGRDMRVWTLAKFSQDEYVISVPRSFDKRRYMLTNKRLLAYGEPADDNGPLEKLFDVPLPHGAADLITSDMVHLLEGTLVSFTFGARMIDGAEGAQQVVYLVDGQGKASEVGRRHLTHDFPTLFEHRAWWVSPAMHALASIPEWLYEVGTIPGNPSPTTRPVIAWIAALASMFGSAAAAWWWLRRAPIAPRLKSTWIASCLLFGLPALLSLMVLQARTPSLAATTSTTALAAT